jgi:hypothetical protein
VLVVHPVYLVQSQVQSLSQVPIYLAAGTAAQQLDASFSTNSNLEIYGEGGLNLPSIHASIHPSHPSIHVIHLSIIPSPGYNLSESGHNMPLLASLPVDQRFHKLVSPHGYLSPGRLTPDPS